MVEGLADVDGKGCELGRGHCEMRLENERASSHFLNVFVVDRLRQGRLFCIMTSCFENRASSLFCESWLQLGTVIVRI